MILCKIFILFCLAYHCNCVETANQNCLWIISFDGFRWDFVNRTKLPNFQWIIDNGISAKWMEPVFMTKTFPAHFSMATGLYVENHGIVGNKFIDSVLKDTFYMDKGSKQDKWWTKGEPIWITATKNNIRSVAKWPGSEIAYNGIKPEHAIKYYEKDSNSRKSIDKVINWLLNGTRLVNFYHLQPDSVVHKKGVYSDEATKELIKADELLGYLISQLKANDLFNTTNIIIVSDHGHVDTIKREFLIKKKNSFDTSLIRDAVCTGSWLRFELKKNLNASTKEKYLNSLQKYLGKNYKMYKSREEIPERWHFRGAVNRIPNYNVFSEPGYQVHWKYDGNSNDKSNHGYDNKHEEMKAIFLAYGPDFQKTPRKVKEVHQVDIYGVALKLLQLDKISPNNGSVSRINDIIYGK